jgi:hypothetical protein
MITCKNIAKLLTFSIVLSLIACTGLPLASEHSGDWKKINTFDQTINTIPLEKEYFFTTLKVDVTLFGLLQRWAIDANIGIEMRCKNDYSIPEKLIDVQTRSLTAGIEELNYIYSKQDLDLSFNKEKNIILFSCGKNNKESYLNDKLLTIKTLDNSIDTSKQPRYKSIELPEKNNLNLPLKITLGR